MYGQVLIDGRRRLRLKQEVDPPSHNITQGLWGFDYSHGQAPDPPGPTVPTSSNSAPTAVVSPPRVAATGIVPGLDPGSGQGNVGELRRAEADRRRDAQRRYAEELNQANRLKHEERADSAAQTYSERASAGPQNSFPQGLSEQERRTQELDRKRQYATALHQQMPPSPPPRRYGDDVTGSGSSGHAFPQGPSDQERKSLEAAKKAAYALELRMQQVPPSAAVTTTLSSPASRRSLSRADQYDLSSSSQPQNTSIPMFTSAPPTDKHYAQRQYVNVDTCAQYCSTCVGLWLGLPGWCVRSNPDGGLSGSGESPTIQVVG
jgi:hypothetical protein